MDIYPLQMLEENKSALVNELTSNYLEDLDELYDVIFLVKSS